MGQLPLTTMFTSFFFWTNIYFYLCIFNRTCSPEWNCRVLTTLHGMIVTFLSFLSAFYLGPWPFSYLAQQSTPLHTAIIIISIGYFIFDFMWCIWYQTEGVVMLAHHMVSLFGLVYCLYTGMYGSEMTAVIGGSEASNPFLQLRWFLKSANMYTGKLATAVDFAFVGVYMIMRLGVGTALHICIQTDPRVDLIPKVGGNMFYIISIIFGVQIARFFVKKYILKKMRKSSTSTTNHVPMHKCNGKQE